MALHASPIDTPYIVMAYIVMALQASPIYAPSFQSPQHMWLVCAHNVVLSSVGARRSYVPPVCTCQRRRQDLHSVQLTQPRARTPR